LLSDSSLLFLYLLKSDNIIIQHLLTQKSTVALSKKGSFTRTILDCVFTQFGGNLEFALNLETAFKLEVSLVQGRNSGLGLVPFWGTG
jgi:hypothetical protein